MVEKLHRVINFNQNAWVKPFRSEYHNLFAKEINKIASSSNDDKKVQSIDLIEIYAYETSKELVCKKYEIKRNIIIKQYKDFQLLLFCKQRHKRS